MMRSQHALLFLSEHEEADEKKDTPSPPFQFLQNLTESLTAVSHYRHVTPAKIFIKQRLCLFFFCNLTEELQNYCQHEIGI